MSELPQGWAIAPLGEACDVIRGITFPANVKEASKADTNVCCLRTTNVQREIEWDDVYFVPRNFVKRPEQLVREGDVLMSLANSYELVGKVAVVRNVPQESAFGAFLGAIRPTPVVDAQYLFHFLRTERAQQELREGSSQTTNIANISIGRLSTIQMPVAPLAEQRRIADKLDNLLARMNACRDRLDRIPAILKQFRQAVLTAATNGELTRDWREERQRSLEGWESTTIAYLIKEKPRNGYSPQAVAGPTPIKTLSLSATTSGRFRDDQFKYIDEGIPAGSHLWLEPGDILIQRANTLEYVGVSAIYEGAPQNFIYPDLMLKCRANERTTTRFLWCALSSERVRTYFRDNATGTSGNMPKINQQTVLNAPVDVPPVDEQLEIVRIVDGLFSLCGELERRHQSALNGVKSLPTSLLSKAFQGKLVAQDPNDEPVAILLERLRAEGGGRSAQKPERRRKPMAVGAQT